MQSEIVVILFVFLLFQSCQRGQSDGSERWNRKLPHKQIVGVLVLAMVEGTMPLGICCVKAGIIFRSLG